MRGSLKSLLAPNPGYCLFAKLKFKDLAHDCHRGMVETEKTPLIQDQGTKKDQYLKRRLLCILASS